MPVIASKIALLVALGTTWISMPAPDGVHVSRAWVFSYLTNADCVVECTIKGYHNETVSPYVHLGPPGDRKMYIFVAELSDVVVHRGFGFPREVEMGFELMPKRWVGQRVILCCYWDPRTRMLAVSRQRLFHRLFDRWVETEWVQGKPTEWRASFTDSELDSVVAANSLSALARAADVIVVGRVDSLTMAEEAPHTVVNMDADRILKGDRGLSFVAFPREWDSPHVRAGQTWIAFLRREDDGYRPLGGCNGLLRFDRQTVYYGRWIRCPISRNAFVERVRRVVAMDNYQKRIAKKQ